jgi:hypothetical protein
MLCAEAELPPNDERRRPPAITATATVRNARERSAVAVLM